jgi:hypothetical protein
MGRQPVNGSTMVVFVVTAVVLPLVLAEFGDWCPWLAVRLVRWAARRLGDPASCQRYEEEWTANLNEVPGKLARLFAAFGYVACLPGMRRSVRGRPDAAAAQTEIPTASQAELPVRRGPGRPPLCPPETVIKVVDLRQRGLSLSTISVVLNAEGVPTPAGRSRWSKSHVDRLLHTRHALEIIGKTDLGDL